MQSVTSNILLALVYLLGKTESVDNFFMALVDRALKRFPVHRVDLDDSTLLKYVAAHGRPNDLSRWQRPAHFKAKNGIRLRALDRDLGTTDQTIANGKYILCKNPLQSSSGKAQIYRAYRSDSKGNPSGAQLAIKISPYSEALNREADIYDRVTFGPFSGRFVNKIEYLAEIDAQPASDAFDKQSALVMEAGRGDLRDLLLERGGRGLEGRALRDAAATAAQCILAMHSRGLVWTDLKTDNFIVLRDERAGSNSLPVVKAIDLEAATLWRSDPVSYSPDACPPEFARALDSTEYDDNFVLGFSYDIWGYGMMLYEVVTGKRYFSGKSLSEITEALASKDFEADVSDVQDNKLRDLIEQCLNSDPKKRPTIAQVLLHPYFTSSAAQSIIGVFSQVVGGGGRDSLPPEPSAATPSSLVDSQQPSRYSAVSTIMVKPAAAPRKQDYDNFTDRTIMVTKKANEDSAFAIAFDPTQTSAPPSPTQAEDEAIAVAQKLKEEANRDEEVKRAKEMALAAKQAEDAIVVAKKFKEEAEKAKEEAMVAKQAEKAAIIAAKEAKAETKIAEEVAMAAKQAAASVSSAPAAATPAAPATPMVLDASLRVVVVGAGGRTGRQVLEQLLTAGQRVIGLVRTESKAQKLNQAMSDGSLVSGLTTDPWIPGAMTLERQELSNRQLFFVGDVLDESSLLSHFSNAKAIIICSSATPKIKKRSIVKNFLLGLIGRQGRPSFRFPQNGTPEEVDYDGIKNIIQAAKKVGVKRIVLVGSMGGTQKDNPMNTIGAGKDGGQGNLLMWKRKGEMELIRSGVTYSIIHTGGLLNDEGGKRELIVGVNDELLYTATRSVPRSDVAAMAVACLDAPQAVNRSFDMASLPQGQGSGPTKDFGALVGSLGSRTCDYSINMPLEAG